ncbi:phospholipase D family protein [Aquimarina sp. ERC-38]|uniref:phospholipase D family protein n=1 Tax=Aquimarina sp. ERC-38 TaxID=2949996 RepID=UPI0022477D69|nr:phospholipase D family protein [Aquimarina sp. ERC-38]UZO79757.1 phospholipase D family protein [Aquimarina sp. ERC-38]
MSKFLTGQQLEEKLTDIIWNAKKYVIIVSPYIKLDQHVISIFDKIKATHETQLILVFGKNEGYKQKSLKEVDLEYFKEFKNIAILYSKDLHAKYYANEKEGLSTSLNLYDYSMINNIECGVYFTKKLVSTTEKLFEDSKAFIDDLIYNQSHIVYLKRPQYKSKLFGLTKSFQNSTVLLDISESFFAEKPYDARYLNEFDLELWSDVEKVFESKPQREIEVVEPEPEFGYCIRTGEQIAYNPEKPLTYYAFKTWQQFGNDEYPENYCHRTGKKSFGKTCMKNPIL